MISQYDWEGGREAMLRFGPDTGPVIVAALPLFEEANRTRAFVVSILRALAQRGVAGALPDMPGQGESCYPLEDATILKMQSAYEAAVESFDRDGRNCYGMAIRSGALLDHLGMIYGRWHLSPQGGAQLLRELTRMKQAEVGRDQKLGAHWYMDADVPTVAVAGNSLSTALLTDLSLKEPWQREDAPDIPHRIVRMESDAQPADLKVAGAPLWRRAEPDNDPALADLLADDIAEWVRACES
ncbi:hypothetical protein [Sphingosinithalassobacter portus]|uniref:hypothetical protein n=1 Tax=Stakelama portus TaxID=2676234 RepID=UPI000D6E4EE9|nr:hypothetical protein [Sphingosinithalassobacter portus]